MTLDEAEQIFLNDYPYRKLKSVIDWNDYYIFGSISTKYDGKAPEFILENPIAVSKSSKKTFTFNPLIHAGPGFKEAAENKLDYFY